MRTVEVEQVFINQIWLAVGGNTPWNIDGYITKIKVNEPDPRNFNGADSVFFYVEFDSGYTLELKTLDYMVVYKGNGG